MTLVTQVQPAAPPPRVVRILGTHGVPAEYGGFETAAQSVALFLVARGWRVIVYCQVDEPGQLHEDVWHGVERVLIPVTTPGWRGTALFDLLSIRHAIGHRHLCLTFGYNTGVLNIAQRVRRIPNVVNMDGIEWSRARWGPTRQAILYVNERISAVVGNHLIADHPEIETYLRTRAPRRKISTITYGADPMSYADPAPVTALGLEPGQYLTLICRPIPENSILELVAGFSRQKRKHDLVVLGDYQPEQDEYHRRVMDAASDQVHFIGSIYDVDALASLRFHASAYLHGHTVGGTNPSLVEAMAAGNAVIAHDNPYNRWVVSEGALYFKTADDVDACVSELLSSAGLRQRLGAASRQRHAAEFTWDRVAGQYEDLLLRHLPSPRPWLRRPSRKRSLS